MANRIFLLEDNSADVRLMQEAFREVGVKPSLVVASSQREAQEYIAQIIAGDEPMPALMLLDINLPAGSGIDVLRHIRGHHVLADVPVLMLTTSDNEGDIRAAKDNGATTYYVKPGDLDGFLDLVREIQAFWLERVSRQGS